MISILAIGLDYLMLQKMKFRGDVVSRQLEYAKYVKEINHVIYSPKSFNFKKMVWGDNIYIHPTSSSSKGLFFLDALNECRRIISETKIDVITAEDPFVTGLVGYILKRQYGIPLNVQIHVDFCDNKYWINDEIENHIFNRLGKYVVKKADSIRLGTSYEKKKFVDLGIDESRISVIPVFSDINKFAHGEGGTIRHTLLGNKFNHLLFTAARITRQKDLFTMVRAMAIVVRKYPDVFLVIAGDGVEKANVEKFIDASGLAENIKMIGAIDHKDVANYNAACDFYVLSSKFEGTCIALAEAAAAGKCVVTSRFAGSYDLVEDGKTGMIFDIGDHAAMAEKIMFLLENKDLAAQLGNAGREKVMDHFSHEKNIEGLIRLWESTARMVS